MADLPPPPENPFGTNPNPGEQPDPYADSNGNGGGLGQAAPNVAAKPGRVLMVLAVVGGIILMLLYFIFFSSSHEDEKTKKSQHVVQAPIQPPPLPAQVATVAPPVIQPPNIPPPSSVQGLLKPEDDSAQKANELARMRSKMLISDSGGGSALSLGLGNKPVPKDANLAFEANLEASKVDRVQATRIASDLRRTIAQGRIIEATTESVINTDLPAPIRAIVSRDTYGEAGTVPLIPKGSRLIGQYNTALSGGQSRVFVVWTRVIRPDGIDVMIDSPLVDQIGQAGIGGQVDTKFQSIFSRSLMSSVVSIAFAIGEDKIQGGSTTTTSTGNGTTTTGDAASTATVNALNRMGSVTDSFLQRFIDVQQTILVDQGTKVNVFVNRDVIFPSDIAGTQILN